MKTSIIKSPIAILLFGISILFAGEALAQAQTTTTSSPNAPPISPQNPNMASRGLDNDKEGLYALWTDYKRNLNPEQQRYAYPTAKEYLRRWGGETDAETKEVKKWVAEYERQMYARDMYTAYDAKSYAKVFELGRPALKSDADNFVALSLMVEAAHDNSLVGKTDFNAEAADYARRAIKLLEDGKVAKPDPFKSMDVARGFLNFALGNFVKDEKPLEAAAAYEKAVKSDSPYHTDPSAYHRLGVTILKGEFAQLSNEYNEKFGGKQSSPEQAAMLSRITHLIEQTIDAYARAVALSSKPEQKDARDKILSQLTAIYKSVHNNSDTGLNELIAGVLSKPIP
jgi:hypothetical protein